MPTLVLVRFTTGDESCVNWSFLLDRRMILPDIAIALNVTTAIVVWPRSLLSPGARAFAWWLVLGGTFSVISLVTAFNGINNHDFFQWYRLFSVLLLGLTAKRLVSDPRPRRMIAAGVMLFIPFWIMMTLSLDSLTWFSSYTDPTSQAIGLIVGILLVAESIHHSDDSPFRRPEAWLGIGLVLACGPAVARFPIASLLATRAPELSAKLYAAAGLSNDVALILWCIPYWKKDVTWTR
jgi:hypothetical protein